MLLTNVMFDSDHYPRNIRCRRSFDIYIYSRLEVLRCHNADIFDHAILIVPVSGKGWINPGTFCMLYYVSILLYYVGHCPLSNVQTIKKYASKAVPLHTMVALGEEEIQLLLINHIGTRWGLLVSITLRPRFAPGKDPWCQLYRRLDGPQSRSGYRG
jgi:hypothetical protein